MAVLPKVREVIFPRKQREIHYHLQAVFTFHLVLIPCGSARLAWGVISCEMLRFFCRGLVMWRHADRD